MKISIQRLHKLSYSSYGIFLGMALILLMGCASSAEFKPKTLAGAQCKVQCANHISGCVRQAYECKEATFMCLDACQELDALGAKL